MNHLVIGGHCHGQRGFAARRGGFRGRGNSHFAANRNSHPHGQGQEEMHKDNPWMTPELLKLIKEKDEQWRVYNNDPTEENHRKFKIKRIEVNMAVNDAKLLFYSKVRQTCLR